MDTIETTYTVALRDYPELPSKERIAAEARYTRVLERKLGGPEVVADALRTVMHLEASTSSIWRTGMSPGTSTQRRPAAST